MVTQEQFSAAMATYHTDETNPIYLTPSYQSFQRIYHACRIIWPWLASNVMHRIACEAGGRGEGHEVEVARIILASLIPTERNRYLDEPPVKYHYSLGFPALDAEKEARQLFNAEYKAKWPGKRANSKEANALYPKYRDKAIEIVTARHQEAEARYNQQEARAQAEYQRRYTEWLNTKMGEALVESGIRQALAA